MEEELRVSVFKCLAQCRTISSDSSTPAQVLLLDGVLSIYPIHCHSMVILPLLISCSNLLLIFQNPQVVAFCVLSRLSSCNQLEREAVQVN